MNRDLSDVFIGEIKSPDFDEDEEMILPISMDESVIFRFDEKQNSFDFDSEKLRAAEIVANKLPEGDFEKDLTDLKGLCDKANPSGVFKVWILFWAVLILSLTGALLLIIWIVLILDLVILAGEVYLLKKLKKMIWKWKTNKVDKGWVLEIEKILEIFNEKYQEKGLVWKFDPDGKWIQLTSYKS